MQPQDNTEYMPSFVPAEKPRVRVRNHLTSVQIDKQQKVAIDNAYQSFMAMSGQFVSKGAFIEGLCLDFLNKTGKPDMSAE